MEAGGEKRPVPPVTLRIGCVAPPLPRVAYTPTRVPAGIRHFVWHVDWESVLRKKQRKIFRKLVLGSRLCFSRVLSQLFPAIALIGSQPKTAEKEALEDEIMPGTPDAKGRKNLDTTGTRHDQPESGEKA